MRADDLPLALLALAAFVVMAPAWTRYLSMFSAPAPEAGFLAALVLPATALLFLSGWVKPELAGVVLGGLLIVGTVLLAPWWLRLIGLVSDELAGGSPFARVVLQLSLPALFLAFLFSMGKRRLKQA